MYQSFLEIATNAATQEEFKDFFQSYHDHLHTKLDFPPLKVSKALHAASEVMGEESWHHVNARTYLAASKPFEQPELVRLVLRDDELDNQLWALQYFECAADEPRDLASPQYFLSEQACVAELWRYVKYRMIELELLESAMECMEAEDYVFVTDNERIIAEIQGPLIDQFRTEIVQNEVQWKHFEDGIIDINHPDIQLEFIDYFFRFMDGDGIRAVYSIEPVNLTKRS